MDETQKGHLTFQRETILSALWTRQLMCLFKNQLHFFSPFEQIPEGVHFETSACLQDFSPPLPHPVHTRALHLI